jgi:hypothetical protein
MGYGCENSDGAGATTMLQGMFRHDAVEILLVRRQGALFGDFYSPTLSN